MFDYFLPAKYLWIHIPMFPSLLIHWELNDNYCFLSQMENRLRNIPDKKVYNDHDDPDATFMKKVFNNLLKIKFTDREANIMVYLIFHYLG